MNSLYQQLQGTGMSTQQIQPQQPQKLNQSQSFQNNKNLLKTLLSSSNPSEMVQKMINQNPKLQGIMSMFNSSGMTPKQFFYQYANSQGVNPDQFLNSLQE